MAQIGFSGGDKLKKHLEAIAKRAGKARVVSTGFYEGSDYPPDNTPVAYVAAIQNYGAPSRNIPPRPFFSGMVKEKSPQWGEKLGKSLKKNDFDSSAALKEMGDTMGGQLVNSITALQEPALSPITLMLRKMFGNHPEEIRGYDVGVAARKVDEGKQGATGTQAKPLVWTGRMVGSVEFAVDGERHKVSK